MTTSLLCDTTDILYVTGSSPLRSLQVRLNPCGIFVLVRLPGHFSESMDTWDGMYMLVYYVLCQ